MAIANAYERAMKTRQLQTLVAIAERGTLMAAAEALCISQPAVTKSIKELETQLGVQLLVRSGAGVRLTPYGEVLVRRARTVIAEIARAGQELEEMRTSADPALSIGVSLLGASAVMPDALRAFRQRFPAAQLNVYECQPAQIVDGLRDGSFDLCVAFVADTDVTAEFRVTPLGSVTQSLAVSSGDALAKEPLLSTLRDAHWLYNFTRESVPAFWSALCGARELARPRRISVCTSQRLYADLASEPGVVSVWTDFLLDEYVTRGVLARLDVDASLPRLTLGLMHRKDLVFSAAAQYFVECVERAGLHD
jgi:DNA-binding transcriptional LysR family regulator